MPAASIATDNNRTIYSVVDRIAAADGGWDFANVDPASGTLFIARSNAITSVDLKTRTVTNQLASASHGHQVLVVPGTTDLVETDGETNLVRILNARTGAVLAELAAGKKPDAAFFDPATKLVAVMNAGDGTVTLVDVARRALAGSIAVGGGLEFGVADGKGGAFVNIENQNRIAVLDLRLKKVVRSIALEGCEGPTGLALVANDTRLISACANGKAMVVDPAKGRVVGTLKIGQGPDAVLVDAKRKRAFIPCGESGTLVQIDIADAARIRVTGTIATQVGAKTGAINLRDGRIYLPTAMIASPLPGAKRGQPVPGTFVILVLAPNA